VERDRRGGRVTRSRISIWRLFVFHTGSCYNSAVASDIVTKCVLMQAEIPMTSGRPILKGEVVQSSKPYDEKMAKSRHLGRGGFRHVQHVRPNRGLTKRAPIRGPATNVVALNSSYSTPSVLCTHSYVMRVVNKMSMMTTLSLCVSCEFSRVVFVY